MFNQQPDVLRGQHLGCPGVLDCSGLSMRLDRPHAPPRRKVRSECSDVTAAFDLLPSHFAITHNPTLWKLIGSVHDFLNGASLLVWTYQHTLGHHPYTNIDDSDPDIMTSSKA